MQVGCAVLRHLEVRTDSRRMVTKPSTALGRSKTGFPQDYIQRSKASTCMSVR